MLGGQRGNCTCPCFSSTSFEGPAELAAISSLMAHLGKPRCTMTERSNILMKYHVVKFPELQSWHPLSHDTPPTLAVCHGRYASVTALQTGQMRPIMSEVHIVLRTPPRTSGSGRFEKTATVEFMTSCAIVVCFVQYTKSFMQQAPTDSCMHPRPRLDSPHRMHLPDI